MDNVKFESMHTRLYSQVKAALVSACYTFSNGYCINYWSFCLCVYLELCIALTKFSANEAETLQGCTLGYVEL